MARNRDDDEVDAPRRSNDLESQYRAQQLAYQQQVMADERAAFEAGLAHNRVAAAFQNAPTGGAAALNHYYAQSGGAQNTSDELDRANFQAAQSARQADLWAASRAMQHERNLMNAEQDRRSYDSGTQRYAARTQRRDIENIHKGRMGSIGAMNNMTSALGGLTSGVAPGSGGVPNIDLYGATGQRIGGTMNPMAARSPLASLLS